MTKPDYVTVPYWREVLDRAGRNAVQTVIPVIVAAQLGSVAGLDPVNVLIAAALAALVTVVKAAAGITAGPSSSLVCRLADRALPAAAATLLTFITIDGTSVAPVIDWRAAGIATVAAALGAVAQAYVSPAVVVRWSDVDLAA